ncbi:interferon alpha/beta receptor 1b isoform X2 [Oreochromis niloticus]|uniref:Cytokine receptor family B member 5 n=1 Tax=Oreochromis niloticus TaxID=8128 RepID=A0A8F2WBV9_ORENI|nr:interferon alpha/beta receptor 1b isoform X2 [Oreochromis niloticus]QWW30843.1 cytokine receptor family B member 5 [Oreochromis niloticus]
MSAAPRHRVALLYGLLLLFFCGGADGSEVPPPQNVTTKTLNTNYTLSWDWAPGAAGTHAVTFTTQYVPRYQLRFKKKKTPNWITACNQTSHRSCDLTRFNLHYLGIFVLRVQATVDGQHSEWAQKEFCPDKEAALGPPSNVTLAPAGSDLDVVLTDPLTSNNTSMREHVPDLYYHVQYWERQADGQASPHKQLRINTTMVTLPGLKAWTWYCVRVQSRYDFYSKISDFTVPHCMQTEGSIPWWNIFLYFLGSLLFFFLIVLGTIYSLFRCCKTVKDVLNPSDQMPSHLKKYLCSSPGSDIPRLLTPDSESELLCEGVTICPPPAVLESHIPPAEELAAPPSGLEPNSSVRHSRQDSSSSGDSGVYSSGGGSSGSSALKQLSAVRHNHMGSDDSFKGLLDPERVNLREMTAHLKSQPEVADEGVVDVCV